MNNPFRPGTDTWNLTEQMRLLTYQPELAAQLRAAAKEADARQIAAARAKPVARPDLVRLLVDEINRLSSQGGADEYQLRQLTINNATEAEHQAALDSISGIAGPSVATGRWYPHHYCGPRT